MQLTEMQDYSPILCEVFKQFFFAMTFRERLCPGNVLPKDFVYFEYDGKMWKGSMDGGVRSYAGKQVHFTNFKLPNDGFFYDYVDGDESDFDDIVDNDETDDNVQVVQYVVSELQQFYPWITDTSCVEVNYKQYDRCFDIYCWDAPRSQCVMVKFYSGTYEIFVNKKAFTRTVLKTKVD